MGAWIETLCVLWTERHMYVAPHMGAWIETEEQLPQTCNLLSHPIWVRGLKLI